MTIKSHIAISATISLALIAIIACQQKTQAPKEEKSLNDKIKTQVTKVEDTAKKAQEAAAKAEAEAREAAKKAEEEAKAVETKAKEAASKLEEDAKKSKSEVQEEIKEIENKLSDKDSSKFNPSDIESATLYIDVFEVNGGAYTNKVVNFNGISLGLLPNNNPPLQKWQTVSINLNTEAIKSINSNNSIAIVDGTKDLYNLRNVCLKVKMNNSENVYTIADTNTFSSANNWWPFKEGKTIKTDGTPFINLIIK